MITSAIIGTLIQALVAVLIGWLPAVTDLPYGITQYVGQGLAYFHSLLVVFWPLQALWNCFMLFVYLQFCFMVVRLFLGHRAPRLADMTQTSGGNVE